MYLEKGREKVGNGFFWKGVGLAWGKEIYSLGDGIEEGSELWEERRGTEEGSPLRWGRTPWEGRGARFERCRCVCVLGWRG